MAGTGVGVGVGVVGLEDAPHAAIMAIADIPTSVAGQDTRVH
jgi:hypothetical protein